MMEKSKIKNCNCLYFIHKTFTVKINYKKFCLDELTNCRMEFNIISESGNMDHWKYSVEYTEKLSHLPSIGNSATGHYSIKPDGQSYLISSEHNTCFLGSYFCGKKNSIHKCN